MRRPPLALLLFTLALTVTALFPLERLRADEPADPPLSSLELFRDSVVVETAVPSGVDPESDSCYFPYPENLHTEPFRKVFQLYTSDAVVNGYGPGIAPGWSAAQFDTFMNAIFDGDPETDTDVFPRVWEYFCYSDLAPEEDSIHVVDADSSITRLQIALYHVWNFRLWDNQGTNPEYCDTLRTRFPESSRFGTADENGLVVPVNPRTRVGCGEHWDTDLFPPALAATEGALAHELQHVADRANTGNTSAGPNAEFLSTAAEYLTGVRWENHRGMQQVNYAMYSMERRYNQFRLLAAYLFGHFSGDPEDITDDLLYKTIRYVAPGQSEANPSFYGMGQVLASDFPDSVPGADGHTKMATLYHRYAMARFAADSTGYAGGIYGFGSSGVSPRNFGWFEWVDTCTRRVDWMPPDLTCGENLVGLGDPVTFSAWTDTEDTVYVNQGRDLKLRSFGSEYVVLRADSTFFTGGSGQTLRVRLSSPYVMPQNHEVKVGVLEYAADSERLFDEPLFRARESVPVTLAGGRLDTELDIADFGDSTRAAVVVVSLVQNPVPYVWGLGSGEIPLTVAYGYAPDTTRVPSEEPTIQAAINETAPGDVVAVAGQPGFAFNESIVMKSGVRVIGVDEGYGLPILNAGTDSIAVVFPDGAPSYTTLENFTVRGGAEGLIHLRGRGQVKRCALEAPASTAPFFGVWADSTEALASVQDCRITLNQGTGVLGLAMDGTALRDTVAVAAGTGIDLRGDGVADSCVVEVGSGTGVFLGGGNAALSASRVRVGSGQSGNTGVAIDSVAAPDQTTMTSIVILAPGGTGIDLRTPNALVTRCTIDSVAVGVDNAGGATVSHSIVVHCGSAGFLGTPATWCIAYGANPFGPGEQARGTGSVDEDPRFRAPDDYSLRVDSYGNPGNNSSSEGIGALPVTCMYGTLTRTSRFEGGILDFLGDTTVPAGDSLSFGPGAVAEGFGSDSQAGGYDWTRPELIVQGHLDIMGTTVDSVVLRSGDTPQVAGDWYGIVVKSGGSASIEHARIAFGTYGIRFEAGASGAIRNCLFEQDQISDLWVDGVTGVTDSVLIEDNTFVVSGARAMNLPYNNSGLTIRNNVILKAATWAEGIWVRQGSGSEPLITGNSISGFTLAEGVQIDSGAPRLTKNQVYGCKYGVLATGGSARLGLQDDSESDNFIHENTEGLRTTGASAAPLVRNNQFTANGIAVRVIKTQGAVADLGTLGGSDGLNSFVSNGACVVNNTTTTVWAVGNWWGECAAPTCNQGTVIINDWRCEEPASVRRPDVVSVQPAAQAIRLVGVHPNPMRSTARLAVSLEGGYGEIGADVFDVAGRLVRRIDPRRFEAGENALDWEGTDGAGRPVATGLYFVRVHANGEPIGTLRVLVLR